MLPKWILVAHRGGARLFAYLPSQRSWHLEESRLFPMGKLRNKDMEADRAGSISQRHGFAHPAMAPEHDDVDHQAERWSRELSNWLDRKRQSDGPHPIILIAEPYLMGKLRAALSEETRREVLEYLTKDLAHVPDAEIAKHVDEFLLSTASSSEESLR